MAVRSEAVVRSTATYQLPPATVRAQVTNAVVRNMYGTGDLSRYWGGIVRLRCSIICAVERRMETWRRQNCGQGCCIF